MTTKSIEAHNIPISKRSAVPWPRRFQALLFFFLFDFGCLMVNGFQLVFLLPLLPLPFDFTKRLYNKGICYTKGAFGCLTILMCQWFAPTMLSVTFEMEGKGRINQEEIENLVTRNSDGEFKFLNLPTKFVLTSNHQIYADWWYAWCLLYFIGPRGVHRHMYITLKKSLKWVPFVGWGMQLYGFIFLARSWAADRAHLTSQLSSLGKRVEEANDPFCFMLYPEGTLVSENTRPLSKKYADKIGVADMTNILLPKSTGLHHSLRSLAPRIPGLRLIDLTFVYPGIPLAGYGQDYYTLRSIFMDGIAPPAVHIHVRMFNVMNEVPIGNVSAAGSSKDVDIPTVEKEQFDTWLRSLWREKDKSISTFSRTQSFGSNGPTSPEAVEIPLKLRRRREVFYAFCFLLPAGTIYAWNKITK